MNGANVEFFFNLCLYALKFDMVIVDAYIDGMGGFQDSNMTHTKNLTIKEQNYNLTVKEMKFSIVIFSITAIITTLKCKPEK